MPRTRYYRKRPGHRAYIASLWQALHLFMEPATEATEESDQPGRRTDGVSDEQIASLRTMLAELGEAFRVGLGGRPLPDAPPDFFAVGAEIPASRFGEASPRLQ